MGNQLQLEFKREGADDRGQPEPGCDHARAGLEGVISFDFLFCLDFGVQLFWLHGHAARVSSTSATSVSNLSSFQIKELFMSASSTFQPVTVCKAT
jgi:hypothetical protein